MQIITKWSLKYAKDQEPVAKAVPGEILQFCSPDCFNGGLRSEKDSMESINLELCNPAAGPVYVEGAMPGDVLGVEILKIETGTQGVACALTDEGPFRNDVETRTKVFPIKEGFAYFNDIKWPVDPMIGVIGTTPPDREEPTGYVHEYGGNMDCRKIRAGSTVWLPVGVPGALLSMGDVHATMGDGEATATGIETEAKITVCLKLVKNFELHWPVLELADRWFVNTCGETCDEAIERGYHELHRLLMNAYGWDATDTAVYISVRGYIEANQAVLVPGGGGNTFRVGTPKLQEKPRLIPFAQEV